MGKTFKKFVAGTSVLTATAVGFSALADADVYTVKSGDTLWDIAINNQTTVEQLMKDNNLTSSLIFPGDQLYFENTLTQVAAAKNDGNYRVVFGDTLYKIAVKFGTTVDNLVELNKISNPNLILVGQNLVVNSNVTAKVESPVVVKKETALPLAPVVKTDVVKETTAKPTVAPVKKEEAKPVETPAKKEEAKPAVAPVKKEEAKPAVAPVKKEEAKPAVAPVKKEEAKPAVAPVKKEEAKPAVATPVASSKAATIFAAAQAQLGVYQDCTLLVTNALRSVGINFHDWPAGYLSLGTVVPASQAVPGDLVYYANGGMGLAHIAVYAGNGQAIHGGWNGNQTVINTVNVGSGPVFIRVR